MNALPLKDRIMKLYVDEDRPRTVKEICAEMGQTRKSVAQRVQELVDEGWLIKSQQYRQREGHLFVRSDGIYDANLLKLPFGKNEFSPFQLLEHIAQHPDPPSAFIKQTSWDSVLYNVGRMLLSDRLEPGDGGYISEDQREELDKWLQSQAVALMEVVAVLNSLRSHMYKDSALREYFRQMLDHEWPKAEKQDYVNFLVELRKRLI